MITPTDEYDSPWKETIEAYFQECLEFFFPEVANDIDWSKKYTFLDKELQKIVRDGSLGRRYVDKLVKVWLKNGKEQWVLIHLEVQSEPETDFEKRMYQYNALLFLSYNCSVASLAILGDDRAKWKPKKYSKKIWGCKVRFKFPIVKLLDYRERWQELEASTNPFATVVMAHLKAKETRQDYHSRKQWKLFITKRLYERGYQKEDVIKLFHFIDWVMRLPQNLETSFLAEIDEYEEDKKMPYVTSVERIGIEKGIQQGIQEGIQQGIQQGIQEGIQQGIQEGIQEGIQQGLIGAIKLGLELKFGSEGLEILPEITPIRDLELLETIKEGIKTANTLAELRTIYGDSTN